jgi:cytoskeletal protein CcmA (bactofilin family)
MSSTTFSGPVTSQNGFIGTVTGSVTGSVTATTLSASGVVILSGLPTADPAVVGQLWSDLGVLTVSAG